MKCIRFAGKPYTFTIKEHTGFPLFAAWHGENGIKANRENNVFVFAPINIAVFNNKCFKYGWRGILNKVDGNMF